ncbi:Hypothetical protein I595_1687 [Croceitalea dokdonensis DOKDO 023]|uniref:Uncharacterized protein n=1 Tax=Croceitalea dokdonensis DOKDO 023 TaxID=1300341 RepID=A0A0P7AZM8_9FLAO|nr:TonB-dependent receptor plug domain-containing protein [Croceitalea dokdonensis]KPM32039.1 Hypothetical protein I595_1687 [Croceitalea dokdonensis DOKDO 023]
MNPYRFLLLILMLGISCQTTKTAGNTDLRDDLEEKNRGNFSLLNQIRQQPGIILRNGVPVLLKANNSLAPENTGEPLYVLNGQILGNSIRLADEAINNFMVKEIKVLSGPDAAIYGSRGGQGVIEITVE